MTALVGTSLEALPRPVQLIRLSFRFMRLAAMGATVSIALLGAVSSSESLRGGDALIIAAVATAHHLFSFIFNDVIDLPIDRTEPRRAESPLVLGLVSPRFALVFALANVPVAFVLSALGGAGWVEQALLAASLALVAVYDLWGKRFVAPPVMDLLQGIGWAMLGWYGAEMVGSGTMVTALLCTFYVGYILMTNGVHGGLRDLANDLGHGAKTTPSWLGATPLEGGTATVSASLFRYAIALQVLNTAITVAMLAVLDYSGWVLGYAVAAWVVVTAITFVTLVRALRATTVRSQMMVQGALHLIYSYGVVLAILAPEMPAYLVVMSIVVYVAPLLTYGWLLDAIRRVPNPRSTR